MTCCTASCTRAETDSPYSQHRQDRDQCRRWKIKSVGTLQDVTERVQAEIEIKEAHELLEKTFASLDQAVIVLATTDRAILTCNQAVKRIFGYSPDELIGRTTEFMYPDRPTFEQYPATIKAALDERGIYTTKMQMRRKDGRLFHAEVTDTELKDENGRRTRVVSVIRDISERVRAEEALQASEERFSIIFTTSPVALSLRDSVEGRCVDVNESYLRLSGFSQEEVIGEILLDLDMFDSAAAYRRFIQNLSEKKYLKNIDSKIRTKSGERRDVIVSFEKIQIRGEAYILASFQDITERKLAEKALIESEERYRTLIAQLPAIVYTDDARVDPPRTQFISPYVENLLGYAPEEWLAGGFELWRKALHPEDRNRVVEAYRTGLKIAGMYNIEYRLHSKTGDMVWVQDQASILKDASGKPLAIHGVIQNITARSGEETLRESEALAAHYCRELPEFLSLYY